LADKISAKFVPIVILLAVMVAVLWWWLDTTSLALVAGVSVLIIACPCALGLATPMSVMVGVGRAAQSGILIRNGDALQNAALIDTLVIDKTGTLTMGAPSVSRVEISNGVDQQALYTLVRSLESHSEHTLATALMNYCQSKGGASSNSVTRINIERGLGLSGVVDQQQVTIGSERFMASLGITVPAHTNDDGLSVVYVAIDELYAARFYFHDAIRSDSLAAIQQLQQQGIECIIVSGDTETSVANVARYLNIQRFHARSLPEDKQAYVANLQRLGKKVAMAGDGINDAPALAAADVSFAMSCGTDIAVSTADIALMRNSLSGVAEAIAVSKATIRNIRQNLFWAFAYNVVSIPIAAGALYPFTGELLNPMIAGAAMALSSVTVASNANRLRWLSLKT
jgi:Cu+-exporting ATPase